MKIFNFIFLTLLWLGIGLAMGPSAGRSLKMEARKYVKQSEAAARKSAPYRKLQQFAAGRRREAMQRDLAESLSYVKNLVVIGRGENMSAQLLLEELSELSKDLGPVFLSMARSIQMFDKETAARQLFEALPFSYAKDIGEFLAGWEDIPPSDLLNTVEVYRSALRMRFRLRSRLLLTLIQIPLPLRQHAVIQHRKNDLEVAVRGFV